MEGTQYNIPMLSNQLSEKFGQDIAYTTVQKCLNHCVLSYNEGSLLPNEERCLRNCFIKSYDFFKYSDDELKFFLRTDKKQN